MLRYLVFGFDDYYPGGGWHDYLCSFVDGSDIDYIKKEARRLAKEKKFDYVQVVDVSFGKIIMEESR